jgi:GNAT superfamily N-acetyltransferase
MKLPRGVAIREALPQDTDTLAEIIRQAFVPVAAQFGLTLENCPTHPSNCRADWIETQLRRGVRFFMLFDDGRPCGCVAAEREADGTSWRLERLAVLPNEQNRGFGSRLVGHVLSLARTGGAERVEIAIIAGHVALRQWYERLGFVATQARTFESLPFEVLFLECRLTGSL